MADNPKMPEFSQSRRYLSESGLETYKRIPEPQNQRSQWSPDHPSDYNGGTVTVNSGNSKTLQTTGRQSYYTIDGLRLISTISGGEGTYSIDLTSVGLSNGWPYNETATGVGNSNITLRNCYVEGAIILYGPNNTVENCEFNGQECLERWDQILFWQPPPNTLIKNNTIHDYLGRAIWINVIADNALIEGNTVYNTWLGIDCDGASKPVTNCHVLHNTIYKTGQGQFPYGLGLFPSFGRCV